MSSDHAAANVFFAYSKKVNSSVPLSDVFDDTNTGLSASPFLFLAMVNVAFEILLEVQKVFNLIVEAHKCG